MSSEQPAYDFRHPDRISKERLRPVQILYDRLARNLGTSLSAYLRAATEVRLASIEQQAYAEFLAALPDQTAYYEVGLDPVEGAAGLEVSPRVAFPMIDRMLGGRGTSTLAERALTDIEQRVVDNVVRLILEHMTEEWRHVGQVRFAIRHRDSRPRTLHIAAPSDPMITLRLIVKVDESEGDLKLCLPAVLLEKMGPGFVDRWRKQGSDAERQTLHRNLAKVPLRAEALLETPLLATDLLRLAVGDVVSLGTSVRTPVELRVCGTQKFAGVLTRTADKTGLTVHSVAGQPANLPASSGD